MAASAGQREGPPQDGGRRRKRLWLVCAALVVVAAIAVVFVVWQGAESDDSRSDLPPDAAAVIRDGPSGDVEISKTEVKRWIAQQISGVESEGKQAPTPSSKSYEALEESAFEELLKPVLIRAEAEEVGIDTQEEAERGVAEFKKANFPTATAYQGYLEATHYSQEFADSVFEEQILGTQIEEQVKGQAPAVTPAAVRAWYEKERAERFSIPASRVVREIVTEDKGRVEAAKEMLEADQSPKAWEEATRRYSSEPTARNSGGVQEATFDRLREALPHAMYVAIFGVSIGDLSGPVSLQGKYWLLEPVSGNPARFQPFGEVRSGITQNLTQLRQERVYAEYMRDNEKRWISRTYCAPEYRYHQCANFTEAR